MELAIYNTKGEKTSKKAKLDDAVFGIEPNDHVIWLDVKRYRNAQRQGTHKAKERGEITGSTRKIKKQKGTGTARAGSIKNPLFRGGGTVFGPRPRKYHIKLNKKVTMLARKSALSYKAKDNEIMVLENFKLDAPKTKDYLAIVKNLKVDGEKTLMIVPEHNANIYMSSKNLAGHKVEIANNLNTYDILDCNKLIFMGDSIEVVQNILNR